MPRRFSIQPPPHQRLPQEVADSAAVLDRIADGTAQSGPRVFVEDSIPDKYAVQPAEPIDCENRVALCKSACCRLSVLLSPQDLAEGIVSWDPRRRYFNSQHSDGSCVHLERPECSCSIYANRPAACRIYDCRRDDRIWLDFEKRIPNPALEKIGWPRSLANGGGAPARSSTRSRGLERERRESPAQPQAIQTAAVKPPG